MQSAVSFPAEKQMSLPQQVSPQTARFVKSPLNSRGEKPSPDSSARTQGSLELEESVSSFSHSVCL